MSDQDNGQVSTLQRPISDDPEAWKTYWKAQKWPWRTEPEIDSERQKYLAERRAIVPDIEKGSYPFKDIKLSRADVEWLLATHENGRGPVNWNDESQRERWGLDLRGAHLCQVNLRRLPLTRLCGGLPLDEAIERRTEIYQERCKLAGIYLKNADLYEAHLEGANLCFAHLSGARLQQAQLERADLFRAELMKADLRRAHLEVSILLAAHLEGTDLRGVYLNGTDLREIVIGNKQHIGPLLSDIQWGDTNLSVVDWSQVDKLGDEHEAQKKNAGEGNVLFKFQVAVRANRQLATVLQAQGLNEDATRFAYRAQLLQRVVLRRQKKFNQYLFSGFIDLLAGYGYRPGRSVIWYLVTIMGFALAYFAIGHLPFWPDAIVYSLTSFHGRGFLPSLDGQIVTLHYPLVVMAAFEAVVGLLIEISFIATFTQRFFGR